MTRPAPFDDSNRRGLPRSSLTISEPVSGRRSLTIVRIREARDSLSLGNAKRTKSGRRASPLTRYPIKSRRVLRVLFKRDVCLGRRVHISRTFVLSTFHFHFAFRSSPPFVESRSKQKAFALHSAPSSLVMRRVSSSIPVSHFSCCFM